MIGGEISKDLHPPRVLHLASWAIAVAMAGVFSVTVGLTVSSKLNQISAETADSTSSESTGKVTKPFYTSDGKETGESIVETCKEGALVAINNYPPSSDILKQLPVEDGVGINKTWLNKMGQLSWRCSHVCVSGFNINDWRAADNKKNVKKALDGAKYTSDGQEQTLQVLTSEQIIELMKNGDATQMKSVVNIDSLKSRCEGPNSIDYASAGTMLNQTKILQRNSTNIANKTASSGSSSPMSIGDANSATGSNAIDDSDTLGEGNRTADSSRNGTPSGDTENVTYETLKNCWLQVTALLNQAGFSGRLASEVETFLASKSMKETGATYKQAIVEVYEPLRKAKKETGTWTAAQHKSADENYGKCLTIKNNLDGLIKLSKKSTPNTNKKTSHKDIKVKINLFLDQSTSKRVNTNSASPVYLVGYTMSNLGEDMVKISAVDKVIYNTQYDNSAQAYLRIPASEVSMLDNGGKLLIHIFTNGGMGSYYRESTIIVSNEQTTAISSNRGIRLLGKDPASLTGTLDANLTLRCTQCARDQKLQIEKWGYDQTIAFKDNIREGLWRNWKDVEKALKSSKVYTLSEKTSDEDYEKVLSELNK